MCKVPTCAKYLHVQSTYMLKVPFHTHAKPRTYSTDFGRFVPAFAVFALICNFDSPDFVKKEKH